MSERRDRTVEALEAVETQLRTNDEHLIAAQVEAGMLRFEVAKQRRWLLLTAVLMLGLVANSLVLWTFLGELREAADQNRRNGEILVECTTPSEPGDPHECYDRTQRSTERAVQQIIDALKE